MSEGLTVIETMLRDRRDTLLKAWVTAQMNVAGARTDLISRDELRVESERFLAALADAMDGDVDGDGTGIGGPAWAPVREFLTELSRTRAARGFTPTETATFVFSLKQAVFEDVRGAEAAADVDGLMATLWRATQLIDALGLFTSEAFLRSREDIIQRQQEELMELSTPVVKLWQGVVAVPLIGTLDSARTSVVMESLLEKILET